MSIHPVLEEVQFHDNLYYTWMGPLCVPLLSLNKAELEDVSTKINNKYIFSLPVGTGLNYAEMRIDGEHWH